MSVVKRILLGRRLASEEAPHQLLPKRIALPVFASDPLSSNAYATEEILIVLTVAGAGSFHLVTPLAAIIATVVVIVIASYRQTIRAYPHGGGSYRVARENLGTNYGLVAAAALLTDYVLTVAVSIAAGAAAITSAAPALADQRVTLSLVFVALVMVANLRGVKESGTLFAIPTYTFVLSIWALLVTGAVNCIGGCPRAASADLPVEVTGSLTLFLILKAFSTGSTALTGIEAIADGVPAFRGRRAAQQAENAVTTITIMGFFTLSMFLGISLLARGTRVHPITEEIAERFGEHETTIVAQIAEAVSGRGFLFFAVQATTAGILILAANTAYADFPRLSSILAKDRFMPRQFMNRGDRLVFSNGIVVLSILAGVLIWAFDASVTRLIQLYVVGVFTTFTLSQAGMVRRWRRLRTERWRARATMNGIGATTTGIVLVVIASTKFLEGAWIVITAMPFIVLGLKAMHRHYLSVGTQLRRPEGVPRESVGTRAVVLVARVDEATMRAIGYARSMRPREVRAIHVGSGEEASLIQKAWAERRLPIDLEIVARNGQGMIDAVRSYMRAVPRDAREFTTVVVPEIVGHSRIRHFLRRRRLLLLKATLLFEPGIVVTDVPTPLEENMTPVRGAVAPTRIIAILPVSGVHNAVLRAAEYARSLSPTDLRALTFNVEPDETERLLYDWGGADVSIPLEAIDSPYRDVTGPLLGYIRDLRARRSDAVVNVIMPEFIVRRWWHQALHNQTSLAIKAALLFEPGVVVTSVPFHLE